MTQAIHIVLQGKGGVGKSVVARLLLEYMIAKDRPYIGFDADPVNQTFAAHDNPDVTAVSLLEGSRIDSGRFDRLMEDIFQSDGRTIILDTGASSFLPFMEYIEKNEVIAILTGEGFEVFLHTIVTGGTSSGDTINGFVQLAERFGETCNVIVWENAFFGPVALGGKPFMEIAAVKEVHAADKVAGKVALEKPYDLHEVALLAFLKTGISFDKASARDNTTFDTMTRHRLKQLREKYVEAMDVVIGETEHADAA